MTSATISCATASGKSLEELSKLIALRAKRLGEFASDAVIATAIDCLKSLRQETRDARRSKSCRPRVQQRGDLFVSFERRGDNRFPCLRRGSRNGPKVSSLVSFASKGMNLDAVKVFVVTPEHVNAPPYYLVAYSASDAVKYERIRKQNRVNEYGGLAKTALGIAMAKLSTRPGNNDSPEHAKIVASKLSKVSVTCSGGWDSGNLSLYYQDQLNYAVPALKGGEAGVNVAFQKAANKVAGIITHRLHRQGDFEHDVQSPFPEVKRRR